MTDTTRSIADQLPVEVPQVAAQGSSATGGPTAVAGANRQFSLWHLFLMTACFALVMALRKDQITRGWGVFELQTTLLQWIYLFRVVSSISGIAMGLTGLVLALWWWRDFKAIEPGHGLLIIMGSSGLVATVVSLLIPPSLASEDIVSYVSMLYLPVLVADVATIAILILGARMARRWKTALGVKGLSRLVGIVWLVSLFLAEMSGVSYRHVNLFDKLWALNVIYIVGGISAMVCAGWDLWQRRRYHWLHWAGVASTLLLTVSSMLAVLGHFCS